MNPIKSGKLNAWVALATLCLAPLSAQAQTSPAVNSLADWWSEGTLSGYERTIYFSTHNAFFNKGLNQDTTSYGGGLEYMTARLYGFSLGLSGYVQRGLGHSDNPNQVDSYLGPNLTAMGEAYLRWEHDKFSITAGNQALDVPFASTYDWRMAPELFQGVATHYGDSDNYLSALWMDRYKSYISDSFTQLTNYNTDFDPFGPAGMTTTSGFWGLGGQRKWQNAAAELSGQAWYFNYNDYAKLAWAQGQALAHGGAVTPFVGVQYAHETGDGKDLAGAVDSQVYGLQLGLKHNSLTSTLGYDYIAPHHNAFLNGALVTPYMHNVASDPLFAQPFLTSTQDLGAGSAYALDINGSPYAGWFVGARYSFMDLKPAADTPSIDQSEYLLYAIYHFSGKCKGLSLSDFFAIQTQPGKANFVQNRMQLEYAFGR